VPKRNQAQGTGSKSQRPKKRLEERIVENQFRLHFDTDNLRRNIHRVFPNDLISLSWKMHGSSAVFSNVLVERELPWYEKILAKLGVSIQTQKYGFVWSSRKVVKGIDGIEKPGSVHYYGSDIWGEAAKSVEPVIPKGYTIYGEIVGFTPDGGGIQGKYDYGCKPCQSKFMVYRITTTNADGKVLEMSWPQVRDFCYDNRLEMVPDMYYGSASSIYPFDTVQTIEEWQQGLLAYLESYYVNDQDCQFCENKVPAEGIVLRVEGYDRCTNFKLKNFRFLKYESDFLDTGAIDIETEEATEVEL